MSLNSAASVLRRALLYGKLSMLTSNSASSDYHAVPSSSPKFLEKSRGLKVDTVAYDLEDSVTLGNKEMARKNIVDFLGGERPKDVGEYVYFTSSSLSWRDFIPLLGLLFHLIEEVLLRSFMHILIAILR
jgi:citrate lyase subunit beta-like protein